MANNHLKWWQAVLMVLLYLLLVFAGNFIGFAGPVFWIFAPVLCGFLAVGAYFYLAARWQNFGVGTCLAIVLLLVCALFGEAKGVLPRVIIVCAGILSDVVRLLLGNSTRKALLFAYPVLALSNLCIVVRLWTSPQWYYQGAIDEMGPSYADKLLSLQSPLYLVAVILFTIAAAAVGVLLTAKVDKKSAALLS